jgi:hypothetical protein
MGAEIPLPILSAALRIAEAGGRAFVRVNFKANVSGVCQHQKLAGRVPLRMAMKVYSPAVVGVP